MNKQEIIDNIRKTNGKYDALLTEIESKMQEVGGSLPISENKKGVIFVNDDDCIGIQTAIQLRHQKHVPESEQVVLNTANTAFIETKVYPFGMLTILPTPSIVPGGYAFALTVSEELLYYTQEPTQNMERFEQLEDLLNIIKGDD